jgi:hypothetical protein
MNRDRIASLVDRLDELVPRQGASVVLQPHGGSADEWQIMANELGFLRLGVDIMRGTLHADTSDGAAQILDVDIDHLFSRESPIRVDAFLLAPNLPPLPAESQDWSVIAAIGGLILYAGILGVFIVGIATVVVLVSG